MMLAYIESKLKEIEGGLFQKICNLYVAAEYGQVSAPGAQIGTNKTTPGTPDAYIANEDGSYIFIEYTTQSSGLFEKISTDIDKCIEHSEENKLILSRILYFHTSHPLAASNNAVLKQKCNDSDCKLDLFDISTLASELYNKYPYILKDELGIDVDTGQILPINDFILKHDSKKLAVPLDVEIYGRADQIKELLIKIRNHDIVLVFGPAGIGKTKLAVEVCKKFEEDYPDYRVLSIKNNDLNLYEDYKRYFAPQKNYLVFVDDANQITSFKHLLDYVSKDENKKFKIIATVRDYAKESVIKKILDHEMLTPELIEIKPLLDEDIIKIAENNYSIKNHMYLDRIVEIAKGNPRLASMASKIVKETNSLGSIHDATGLVERYYNDVIEDNQINEDDFVIMACIYMLDGIYFEDTETMGKLFDITGLTEERFKMRAIELHRNEIIDYCEDVAVKPSEQILSCYLAYCAMFKKKYILISDILRAFFKSNNASIISGINGIYNYFRYDEVYSYLKEQVDIAWSEVGKDDNDLQLKYLRAFHAFNPDETLSLIKSTINDASKKQYTGDYSIKKRISDDYDIELEILKGYANTPHYKSAIDLAFLYSDKKQDKYDDIISILTSGNAFGINEVSHRKEYEQQLYLINKAIEKAMKWGNKFYCQLFIELAKHYLKIGFEYNNSSGKHTFTFGEIQLLLCDGAKKIRELIWLSLLELYSIDTYKIRIISVLYEYNIRYNYNQGSNEEEIAAFDSKYLFKFKELIDIKHFENIHPYYTAIKQLSRFGVDINQQVDFYLGNNIFSLYYWLLGEKFSNFDFETRKEFKEKDIRAKLDKFFTDDFLQTIENWDQIKLNKEKFGHDLYQIDESMREVIISAFDKDNVDCLTVLKKVLDAKARLIFPYGLIFKKSIEKCGMKETENEILNIAKTEKLFFVYCYLQVLDEPYINTHYLDILNNYYAEEIGSSNNYIIKIDLLKKFYKLDRSIYINIIGKILETEKDRPLSRISFHQIFGAFEDVNKIREYFSSNIELLKLLYFKMLKTNNDNDYQNEFFKQFLIWDVISIEEYIDFNMTNEENPYMMPYAEKLVCIWDMENYKEQMNVAISVLIQPEDELLTELKKDSITKAIFTLKQDGSHRNKQDEWIKEYINNYYNENYRIERIFVTISEFLEERRLEHIGLLVTLNKSIDLFKRIRFEPSSKGWSGSEIPIIDKEIEFYKKILNLLEDIELLEHRIFINEIITRREKYKKQRKIDEFLRDY